MGNHHLKARYPDDRFIRETLDEAESRIGRTTRQVFLLSIDKERGVLSVVRNDGHHCAYRCVPPLRSFRRLEDHLVAGVPLPVEEHSRLWFKGEIEEVVKGITAVAAAESVVGDEPEDAVPPETEQRYAVVLAFGSRPDVVLTPAAGVPADEATRVYWSFIDAAAAIGGRPAMLPLGA